MDVRIGESCWNQRSRDFKPYCSTLRISLTHMQQKLSIASPRFVLTPPDLAPNHSAHHKPTAVLWNQLFDMSDTSVKTLRTRVICWVSLSDFSKTFKHRYKGPFSFPQVLLRHEPFNPMDALEEIVSWLLLLPRCCSSDSWQNPQP